MTSSDCSKFMRSLVFARVESVNIDKISRIDKYGEDGKYEGAVSAEDYYKASDDDRERLYILHGQFSGVAVMRKSETQAIRFSHKNYNPFNFKEVFNDDGRQVGSNNRLSSPKSPVNAPIPKADKEGGFDRAARLKKYVVCEDIQSDYVYVRRPGDKTVEEKQKELVEIDTELAKYKGTPLTDDQLFRKEELRIRRFKIVNPYKKWKYGSVTKCMKRKNNANLSTIVHGDYIYGVVVDGVYVRWGISSQGLMWAATAFRDNFGDRHDEAIINCAIRNNVPKNSCKAPAMCNGHCAINSGSHPMTFITNSWRRLNIFPNENKMRDVRELMKPIQHSISTLAGKNKDTPYCWTLTPILELVSLEECPSAEEIQREIENVGFTTSDSHIRFAALYHEREGIDYSHYWAAFVLRKKYGWSAAKLLETDPIYVQYKVSWDIPDYMRI